MRADSLQADVELPPGRRHRMVTVDYLSDSGYAQTASAPVRPRRHRHGRARGLHRRLLPDRGRLTGTAPSR